MSPALKAGGFFAAGAAAGGMTTAAATTWLGRFDPKYRGTPTLALQLELAGVVVLIVIGSILLIVTLRMSQRRNKHFGWLGAFVAGAVYPPILYLLHNSMGQWVEPESAMLPLAIGTALVAYPIAAALLLAHSRSSGSRSAQAE